MPPGPPPPSPHQPEQGQQPGPPPTGWVALTLQGSVMTSNMIPPKVTMNGYPVTTSYGQNVVPVHPGRLQIDVSCQWLRTYGQAALTVDVAPGQTVPVFYAAPLHQFTRGNIGFEKQTRPGVLGFALLMGFLLAVVGLMVGLAVAF